MPSLIVIDRSGQTSTVPATSGFSLMETLRDTGFDEIEALCGGCCSCATCHVIIDPTFLEKLPPVSADEDDLLDSVDARATSSRLSCQIPISDELEGMIVTIPS